MIPSGVNRNKIIAMRMDRQHLRKRADEAEYAALYRDCQPGQNVYWNGFGDPPSLIYRADFDDMEWNRERQRSHSLMKGRFSGGNLGWIVPEDIELFSTVFCKPLLRPTDRQILVMEMIEQNPMTIHQIKDETGWLVKEITPILHRLQEAFLIYEDQFDGEWDRGWHKFHDMFPEMDLNKYDKIPAIAVLLKRFAYRHICFDLKMAKSFYRITEKDIRSAISYLVESGELVETDLGLFLREDRDLLDQYDKSVLATVYALHRNDFLVKSNEHQLKESFPHSYPDTLYYLLIDGVFRGAVVGKFRYTPEVEDVLVDLPEREASRRKEEIIRAVHVLCGENNQIKRYQGEEL